MLELLAEYRKCRYGGDEEDEEDVKEPPTKEEVQVNMPLSLSLSLSLARRIGFACCQLDCVLLARLC